jgi:hypothetical protein
MTTSIVKPDTASIIADISSGGAAPTVDVMIGIGLQKDSEAVFFQYQGDDNVQALMYDSGKPVTRIGNIYLTGLSIADDVYAEAGFSGSKLNVFVETQQGRSIMITSGLTTIWSQCLLTSLQGLSDNDALSHLIAIDTWKGNSKMKPCFAAVRDGSVKVSSDVMYQALADARADRDRARTEALLRDTVEVINAQLNGVPVDVKEVDGDNLVPATDEF